MHYHDTSAIEAEIARFKRIASEGRPFAETFMTAPSPGIIASTMLNAFYASQEDYLDSHRSRDEATNTSAIHKAGLILQIDAPDLAMDRTMFYRDQTDAQFAKTCEMHVAMINKGIEGIPRDRVRLHICYGNWEGPHIHDIALDKILPALYQANVGALSIEFSNPRHAHEYRGAQARAVSEGHDFDPRRGRDHQQFRRASGSGGAAHRGSGRRDRRSRARHCFD